jgi:transcriptional regulator with XRE-family HTH domain
MQKDEERAAIRRAYGYTLRSLRQRIGLAQERMALEAAVDRAYVSGLERGLHTPTLETVIRFLPFLKVSFPEFAAEYDRCLRKARREAKRNGPAD